MFSVVGRDPRTKQVLVVEIDTGHIVAIRPSSTHTDWWIAPGLIDLQVNGFAGLDINAPSCTPEVLATLTRVLAARGTTTFLPTIITNAAQDIARLLAVIRRAREQDALSRHAIAGIHLEGPFLSEKEGYRGAHNARHIMPPSLEIFDHWQVISGGLIRMVTLSPHWPKATEMIHGLRRRGVVVAIGHTHADAQQIRAAVDAGARLSTHLGNALPTLLHRHQNPLWAQLSDPRLTSTLIADGVHLPDELLRTAFRVKGRNHCILISDSVALAGSKPGEYETHIGDQVTVRGDGSIWVRGKGLLAGSGICLIDAVGYAANIEAIGIGNSIQMATVNPAAVLGRDAQLRVGREADLVLFSWQPGMRRVQLEEIYAAGQKIVVSAA